MSKMVPVLAWKTEKTKHFSKFFLIIYRYLNIVKKSEDKFIANRKFTQVVTTLKCCTDYGKNMLFSLNFVWN